MRRLSTSCFSFKIENRTEQRKWDSNVNKTWMALLAAGALLAACSGEAEDNAANSVSDGQPASSAQETHTAEENNAAPDSDSDAEKTDESAGTTTAKAPIVEADNVPPEEKDALLAVFDAQIAAFNEKNVDAYMSTISRQAESFDYEEEKEYVEKVFTTFDVNMKPENVTIIQYDEEKQTANVFMNMMSTSKDLATGKEVTQSTRQIMVFQKEPDGWKQVSLFAME